MNLALYEEGEKLGTARPDEPKSETQNADSSFFCSKWQPMNRTPESPWTRGALYPGEVFAAWLFLALYLF